MSVMRNRPKGARFAPFGLGLCIFALIPTELGYQDIASLLARQPGVAERWQKRVYSAASNIQLATYSFGRPIGTASPQTVSYRLARLDNQDIDITGSLTRNPLVQAPPRYQMSDFPRVDRTLKGDRLVTVTPEPIAPAAAGGAPAREDPSTSNASVKGAKTADAAPAAEPARLDPELAAALSAPPLAQYDVSMSLEAQPLDERKAPSSVAVAPAPPRDHFSFKTSSLFFGSSSLGTAESMERWQPGEEPMIVLRETLPDPDLKVMASLPTPADEPSKTVESGESIAAKGEVNADNQRAKTPAERLGLVDEKSRAKSEKCLTEVIYFEARGEAVRGQIAVAQVVLNRAFSGKYPDTVCGVVYQNKHRHLACQFTFACDNNPDVVKEPDMWDRARKIAKAMLDGQIWLPEVAKSTHYHAYWVRPSWVSEMKKMYKTGVHTFYRPRNWGDGSEAPSWGTMEQTAEISAKLAEAARSSAELASATVRR
ncbi:cell wall hydrolase [Bradyrhizobium sp.]|uniref:cell wall hydrolase n=1 Tax=Bradyrhizobium sp. TaxID=376 RepID=UPI0027358B68|nr:cell wall hydrolase [Bradyrhizobium sp.]MDP3075779.1 cell wall hydrolase [Bradyrhizobium sp.]